MIVKFKELTLTYTELYRAIHKAMGWKIPSDYEGFLQALVNIGIVEVKETPSEKR